MDPALGHKEGSVGPPQFDAVIGHASNQMGVWLLKLQGVVKGQGLAAIVSMKFTFFSYLQLICF